MEKRYITAEEAKKMTDESVTFINRVFKAISEMAKEGIDTLEWSLPPGTSKKAIDKIKYELDLHGFNVTDEVDYLVIKW